MYQSGITARSAHHISSNFYKAVRAKVVLPTLRIIGALKCSRRLPRKVSVPGHASPLLVDLS